MTHTYSRSYLSNAKDRLSSVFDYSINDCGMKPERITSLFLNTGYAEQFEKGNSIDKAQEQILYKLSRVLRYGMEDLLENPMM